MSALLKFHQAWSHHEYHPEPVSEEGLAELEKELCIVFPDDYRKSILSVGVPNPTSELWDWLEYKEEKLWWMFWRNLADLSEIYAPNEIREALGWYDAGLPRYLIPIADDSSGNQFCYSSIELISDNKRAAIYFWDHDFRTVHKVGKSFDTWLKKYVPFRNPKTKSDSAHESS